MPKNCYTGEIDRFFNYQLGALEWRSLRFEDEIIDMPDYQGNAVVNYTEYEIPYTRIAEHQHFEPGIKHKKQLSPKNIHKNGNKEMILIIHSTMKEIPHYMRITLN